MRRLLASAALTAFILFGLALFAWWTARAIFTSEPP